MSKPNELLWSQVIENEDWDEAARIQELAQGIGSLSTHVSETIESTQALLAPTPEFE